MINGQINISSIDLLIEVATRFYKLGETQAEISRSLGVDPSTVSRQLKRARDEGIVEVHIRRPETIEWNLGCSFAHRFGLKRAVIVEENTQSAVAYAAANYLNGLLCNGERLGLSFGRMPAAVIRALPAGTVSDVKISPLLGGFDTGGSGIQGHELAQQVAALYPGSIVHYLHAPLLVEKADTKEALLQDRSIRAAFEAAQGCEIALIGIGSLADDAPFVRYGHLGNQERSRLLKAGAVGDLCGRFFRINGEPVTELDDRLMAIELKALAAIPIVIAVASGAEKYQAIRGALQTNCLHTLVTDKQTALDLLGSEAVVDSTDAG